MVVISALLRDICPLRSGRLHFQEVLAEGDGDGLRAVCRTDLREKGLDVGLNAVPADAKFRSDFLVRAAGYDSFENFSLTLGEIGNGRILAEELPDFR